MRGLVKSDSLRIELCMIQVHMPQIEVNGSELPSSVLRAQSSHTFFHIAQCAMYGFAILFSIGILEAGLSKLQESSDLSL